jgi:multidrug resistance efflux pump
VLAPQQSARAGVEIGGVVETVHVRTGQWVEAGQPLLTLHNPDVELEARTAALSFESAKLQLAVVESDGSLKRTSMAPEAALALDSAATALDRARRREERLVVRAPVAGYVTTPDIERLQGRYLQAGYQELRVADQSKFKLLIPLTEAEAQLVELGSRVRGHLRADGRAIEGTLTVLPSQKATWDDYQPAMVSAFGGPAPIETKRLKGQTEPQFPIFIAEADLTKAPSGAADGLRAKVTITGRRATYAERIWRWLASLWRRQKF